MPLRYKTKTLGELQQGKQIPEIDSRRASELETVWQVAYSQGLRDGVRLAREIVFGEWKKND